jgi:hypothetical protein
VSSGDVVVAGCEHGQVNTRIERLKVCLNGGRSREDHPAVPLAPASTAALRRFICTRAALMVVNLCWQPTSRRQ